MEQRGTITPATALLLDAKELVKRGWCKGRMYKPARWWRGEQYCLAGAMMVTWDKMNKPDEAARAFSIMHDVVANRGFDMVASANDARKTRKKDVLDWLDEAIEESVW